MRRAIWRSKSHLEGASRDSGFWGKPYRVVMNRLSGGSLLLPMGMVREFVRAFFSRLLADGCESIFAA